MNNIYVSTYLKWCEEDLRMACNAVNIQQHEKEEIMETGHASADLRTDQSLERVQYSEHSKSKNSAILAYFIFQ